MLTPGSTLRMWMNQVATAPRVAVQRTYLTCAGVIAARQGSAWAIAFDAAMVRADGETAGGGGFRGGGFFEGGSAHGSFFGKVCSM